MFGIQLIQDRGPDGEVLGEITIGEFKERFICTPASEELGWKIQLGKLLSGEPVVFLKHDPRFAWVFYREGDFCFVQQRLSLDGKFENLLPRQTKTEDDYDISEWRTTIEAIREFVEA